MRRLWRGVLVLTAALSGCTVPPPTRQPMDMHVFMSPQGSGERAVVFLPGRKDRPDDFVTNAFLSALWARYPDSDAYIPDAHLGFYAERVIIERLHEDVFAPLRARGYRDISVVGVSMGGLGALLYSHRHPAYVDRIALLAPYLGEQALIDEVRAAGGPRSWTGPRPGARIDGLTELWGWLAQWPQRPPAMPVHLAYGADDRFAPANAMLGDLLPPERTFTREGGHRWVVWQALWQQLLDKQGFMSAPDAQRTTANR
ncbi:alpha/beta hydrolase [Ectothiorhodospiraceae bacterium WFHF3C12]|nr:alpha/beta hydrolase [Ectothiorhodospiraceae bacterium WFHF3C12]